MSTATPVPSLQAIRLRSRSSRHAAIWGLVPTLPAPRALVLLTVEELSQRGRPASMRAELELEPDDYPRPPFTGGRFTGHDHVSIRRSDEKVRHSVDEDHPIETSEIAASTGLSQAAAGNHLRALAEAGLIKRIYVLGAVDPEHPGRAPRALVRFLPELELGKRPSSSTKAANK